MKKPDRLCVVDSAYTLFLYLVMFNEHIANTLFITADGIPKKVIANLPHHIEFPTFRKAKFSMLRRLIYCFYFLLFKKNKYKGLDSSKVYGQDHLFYSFVFMKNSFVLVEDGLGNYIHSAKRKASFIRKLLLGGEEWGYSNKVETIYLTGLAPIPEKLQNKTVIVDIKESWERINASNKKIITKIFNAENIISMEDVDVIVMTQPFSEDNVISEQEKVELYKKIINNYDGLVAIKPHPREVTDYKAYFSVPVLDGAMPVQLMMLFSRPKRIATCFSSVSANDLAIPVDTYGTVNCIQLEKKYGLYESNVNAV